MTPESLPLVIRAHFDKSVPARRAAPTVLSTELDRLTSSQEAMILPSLSQIIEVCVAPVLRHSFARSLS
jgi:hypothetical protein